MAASTATYRFGFGCGALDEAIEVAAGDGELDCRQDLATFARARGDDCRGDGAGA